MNIHKLKRLTGRPPIYTPGETQFWDDPHIARQMLQYHLARDIDAASYRHETIDRIVEHIVRQTRLEPGHRVLDTGCGPGLYCERLAQQGMKVTGVDISSYSIDYAIQSAEKQGLDIQYQTMNYLDMAYENMFDLVMIVYQDFCALHPQQQAIYLDCVNHALKNGAYFVLDVSTPAYEDTADYSRKWDFDERGFWCGQPHLALHEHHYYEQEQTYLDQHIIITDDGEKVYRIYQRHYLIDDIHQQLAQHGLHIEEIYADLTGTEYYDQSSTMGIIARKA